MHKYVELLHRFFSRKNVVSFSVRNNTKNRGVGLIHQKSRVKHKKPKITGSKTTPDITAQCILSPSLLCVKGKSNSLQHTSLWQSLCRCFCKILMCSEKYTTLCKKKCVVLRSLISATKLIDPQGDQTHDLLNIITRM